jgi:uncharacterized protein (DUF58 family)
MADEAMNKMDWLDPAVLASLPTMELRTRAIVQGLSAGLHRSPHRGYSVEFAQHRPYAAGDDVRHIDWRVYGRTDRLVMRQYEQETNLDLLLVLDTSNSMAFGSIRGNTGAGWTKWDHARAMGVALACLALREGDRVAIAAGAEALGTELQARDQRDYWREIARRLDGTQPAGVFEIEPVVNSALRGGRARRLLVIVSDLYIDLDPVDRALGRLSHAGHDVILLQVVDPAEVTFELSRTTAFHDLEQGTTATVQPRSIRDAYLVAFEQHQHGMKRIARRHGFDFEVVHTDASLRGALAGLLDRRRQVLARERQR